MTRFFAGQSGSQSLKIGPKLKLLLLYAFVGSVLHFDHRMIQPQDAITCQHAQTPFPQLCPEKQTPCISIHLRATGSLPSKAFRSTAKPWRPWQFGNKTSTAIDTETLLTRGHRTSIAILTARVWISSLHSLHSAIFFNQCIRPFQGWQGQTFNQPGAWPSSARQKLGDG
jgi:hypothetical protein